MSGEFGRSTFRHLGERAYRIDSPPSGAEERGAEAGGLLDLFRAWIRRTPQDRRTMPRHPVRDLHVWLGWRRGEEAFFATPARMVNISRGGALIAVADPLPAEGESVWLCLGEPDPNDCLQATVLEVAVVRGGESAVRLHFSAPCPHAFFEAAVCMLPPPKLGDGRDPSPGSAE